MNNIKKALACAAAVGAAALATATPVVSDVTMTQGTLGRKVTITYKLTEDAVVTLDVQTNATPNAATGWASIGGKAVCNAEGAVWRKVTGADADGNGNCTITWRPDCSWTDESGNGFKIPDGCAKAVVTAWALDNTPNYMVVDISAAAQPNAQKYYPGADFVPGGILGMPEYRTTKLVMRKIMAKGVEWTMGSTTLETQRIAASEATHQVTLTNNYYIGVFEITQAQWDLIQTSRLAPSYFNDAKDRAMRPVEYVSYNEIRNAANSTTANTSYDWPADPNPGSFLGLLRTKTGIDFDLPSDAQWEFAARSGHGDTKWGDGSAILNTDRDANLDRLGRYGLNGGQTPTYAAPQPWWGATNGTAIVGSYLPNSWGVYDMHGNVYEWCLDWYEDNITANDGKVNVNPSAPAKTLSGASGANRMLRGGGWVNTGAKNFRSACRGSSDPTTRNFQFGLRVSCTAGLQ
ncbi:MAG: formylglycine-generating enzyme family protein [Kiritimatiellae bacterium]|nr:formylglycine-generating enzyme family protein [Kiritimatiellia bacterium]